MSKLPITLAMFSKNNEKSIELAIQSIIDVVNEFVLVDTGSTDSTIDIAKKYNARVYQIGFTDFGNIRTITAHLASEPWILGLDTDEIINRNELPILSLLLHNDEIDAWGLPRRRWADLNMTQQIEKEAYPDYQYRLIRNKKYLVYKNRVHERLDGARKTEVAPFPHIEHFQDVFKTGDKLKARNKFYQELYSLDIQDGIQHSIPPISDIDNK